MLDLKYVLANVEAVKQNCREPQRPGRRPRRARPGRRAGGRAEGPAPARSRTIRRRQNEVAQATGKEKDPAQAGRAGRRGEAAQGRGRRRARSSSRQLDAELKQRLGRIPNLTHPDAPVGATEDDEPRAPQGRHAPGLRLQAEGPRRDRQGARPDRLRGRRQGLGHGFYFLKNDAVLLDLALQQFAIGKLVAARVHARSSPPTSPAISILEGIGFNPRGAETQVYSVEDSDLCLIGTAEITLGGMHADEVFDEAAPAAQVRRPLALLPDRGRRRGPGEQGAVPGPPVHQGRDVRLHDPRDLGRDPRRSSWRSRRRSSPSWASPTACSTSARATSAARPTASSTSRPGCPAGARPASTAR